MSSITSLRRDVVLTQDPPDFDMSELRQHLADKANKILGYDGLQTTINQNRLVATAVAEKNSALQILQRLNIRPYKTSDVDKYKRRALLTARGGLLRFCLFMVRVLAAVAVVMWLYCWVIAGMLWLGVIEGRPQDVKELTDVGTVFAFVAFGLVVSAEIIEKRTKWMWKQFALGRGYRGRIPDFALDTAISVKEAIPNASLFVEELLWNPQETSVERPVVFSRDPFLVLKVGDHSTGIQETYYLEVWDEREFENAHHRRV